MALLCCFLNYSFRVLAGADMTVAMLDCVAVVDMTVAMFDCVAFADMMVAMFDCVAGADMTAAMFDEILKEISSLISESDLHVSQVTNRCTAT